MAYSYVILVTLMDKKYFSSNIIWYIFLGILLSVSVNWKLCTIQRGKYLLGIYYNGHFQNSSDGEVYKDYLKTHQITDNFIKENI